MKPTELLALDATITIEPGAIAIPQDAAPEISGPAPIDLAASFPALTRRERQVGALLVQGWDSKRIAEHLQISHRTVEDYRHCFYLKVGANNAAHAGWIVFGRPAVTA